jgi:hypothetical protein
VCYYAKWIFALTISGVAPNFAKTDTVTLTMIFNYIAKGALSWHFLSGKELLKVGFVLYSTHGPLALLDQNPYLTCKVTITSPMLPAFVQLFKGWLLLSQPPEYIRTSYEFNDNDIYEICQGVYVK